jgi:hypothetical protein
MIKQIPISIFTGSASPFTASLFVIHGSTARPGVKFSNDFSRAGVGVCVQRVQGRLSLLSEVVPSQVIDPSPTFFFGAGNGSNGYYGERPSPKHHQPISSWLSGRSRRASTDCLRLQGSPKIGTETSRHKSPKS